MVADEEEEEKRAKFETNIFKSKTKKYINHS